MAETAETRAFRIDPLIIFDVIQKQAGTIAKGILELVMNAIDAGTDRVELTITREGFTIADFGRGFTKRKEIEEWFECFGHPHQPGDAIYGKFRMGRGQIMSFAQTAWRSGPFLMTVDIKNHGLEYDLVTHLPKHRGCAIEGTWYEPLTTRDMKATIRDLREMALYAQVPLNINGEVISKPPAGEAWDRETDEAYFKFEPTGGLRVYNLGVLVRSYPAHQHGTSGVVVSKQALDVNFARNEIMMVSCLTWKGIKAVLSEFAQEKAQGTTRLDSDARRNLMEGLATGAVAMSRRDVIVVDEAFIKSCGMADRAEFEEVVRAAVTKIDATKADAISVDDAEEVLSSVSNEKTAIKNDDLSTPETTFLSFLSSINGEIARMVAQRSGYRPTPRRLQVGESETAHGWTDGRSYIYVRRDLLSVPLTVHSATHVVMLLVHEYLHDSSDHLVHPHDQEFFRQFHDTVSNYWFGNQPLSAWIESKLARAHSFAA